MLRNYLISGLKPIRKYLLFSNLNQFKLTGNFELLILKLNVMATATSDMIVLPLVLKFTCKSHMYLKPISCCFQVTGRQSLLPYNFNMLKKYCLIRYKCTNGVCAKRIPISDPDLFVIVKQTGQIPLRDQPGSISDEEA